MTDPTALQTVLHHIYANRSQKAVNLSPEAEAEAIEAARAGDSDAFVALLQSHAATLRKHSVTYRSFYEFLGAEEAQSIAVGAVWKAVEQTKKPYLAGVLWDYLDEAFSYAQTRQIDIPRDTMARYQSVMRAVDGDASEGYARCYELEGMEPSTFLAVHRAANTDSLVESAPEDGEFRGTKTLDAAMPIWGDPSGDAEEAEQTVREAHIALGAMCEDPVVESPEGGFGPSERELVEIKYHFQDDFLSSLEAPNTKHLGLSDDFIRQEVSLRYLGAEAVAAGDSIISRQKVQRTVQAALAKGREAILAARAAEAAE